MNTENVTKVYLTETERRALCFAACHFDERGGLKDIASRFALKDAILKLKAMTPLDPARLTKGELEALCDAIDDLHSKKGGERVAVLGSSALVNPLREALLKVQMALYPEEGTPQ